GASARAVYAAGKQLLAGAARALNEHARLRLGDQPRLMQNVLHPRALGHEIASPVLVASALPGPREFQRLLDLVEQVLAVERLGLKSEDATARGGDGVRYRAVGGEDDHGKRGRLLAYLVE